MYYHNFRQYSLGTDSIGIGFGVVSLITRYIGFTLLLSLEIFLEYGILAVVGYTLTSILAMSALGLLGKRIRREFPEGYTIGDYLHYKLNPFGYKIMLLLLLATTIEGLLIQGQATVDFFTLLVDAPSYLVIFCFFSFCFLLAGLGGITPIHNFAMIQVICIYAAVILIPMYFFFSYGVQPIYDGMRLYHPYLLVTNYYHGLIFLGASIIAGIGQSLVDPGLWQRVYTISENKVFPAFLLAGLLSATLPIAFSTLFMIALFNGGYDDISSLWLGLIQQIDPLVFKVLFIICSFCITSATYGAGLHALSCLCIRAIYEPRYSNATEKQKLQAVYLCALFICFLSTALIYFFPQVILNSFVFWGITFVVIATAMIFIIISKKKADAFIPFCATIGLAAGYMGRNFFGDIAAIFIALMVSIVLMATYQVGKILIKGVSEST